MDRAPRPLATRVAAAAAAVALAVAVPVLFVLFAVVGSRWRPLVAALLALSVIVPLVLFFVRLSATRRRAEQERAEGDLRSP